MKLTVLTERKTILSVWEDGKMLLKAEWQKGHNYSRNVSQIPTGHLLCFTDEEIRLETTERLNYLPRTSALQLVTAQ